MKSLGELMFDLKEDPEKERLRQRSLDEARVWEESDEQPSTADAPPGYGADPLLQRLQRALPHLNASQRHMLVMLLDSWGR